MRHWGFKGLFEGGCQGESLPKIKFSDFTYFCLSGEWELLFERTDSLQTEMLL